MVEQPKPTPQRPSKALLPVLTAVTYLAAVIAAFGFISLFADRDVIDIPDAGTLLGPAMVASATIITLVASVRALDRPTPWGPGFLGLAGSYCSMLLIGGIGYALVKGQALWVIFFISTQAVSPFVLVAAALSGLAVIGLWAVSRHSAVGWACY